MQYRFTRAVTIEHEQYRAGDVVADADLPAGTAQSLLGVGWLARLDPPKPAEKPAERPQTAKK